ncbi:MAG: WD40 repeat domain-containing protein [Planctomycetes bacterium]|nr:WD40 repeat domain-containing protein [Planctomycetota bacterium]
MRVLKTPPARIIDVAFSPDCRAVAAAVEATFLLLWNLDSPTIAPVRLDAAGAYRPGGLRFSADGRQLLWHNTDGPRAYDRDTRANTSEPPPQGRTAAWWDRSDDGTRGVSAHGMPDYHLAGWLLKGDEWVRQWALSTRDLSADGYALEPSGARFAMLTRPTTEPRWWERPMRLEVRDAATADVLSTGAYPYSYAARLRFHPAGKQVAGINAMTLLAWDLPAGGEPRVVHSDNRKHLTALAYDPTGARLFVTSNDETVHVFDPHTLARVNRYEWQLDKLSTVTVSPDGTLAAAGSATGDVVVWDLD